MARVGFAVGAYVASLRSYLDGKIFMMGHERLWFCHETFLGEGKMKHE